MTEVRIDAHKSDLWIAGRQEALRWQGFLKRLPLFILTASALYGLSIGLLSGASKLSLIQQVFVLMGYAAVYWVGYIATRLVQTWLKAGRVVNALFKHQDVAPRLLSLSDGHLTVEQGEWRATVPRPSLYMTRDFVFFDTPLLPWLPTRRTDAVADLIDEIRHPGKKKGAETTPDLVASEEDA